MTKAERHHSETPLLPHMRVRLCIHSPWQCCSKCDLFWHTDPSGCGSASQQLRSSRYRHCCCYLCMLYAWILAARGHIPKQSFRCRESCNASSHHCDWFHQLFRRLQQTCCRPGQFRPTYSFQESRKRSFRIRRKLSVNSFRIWRV